MKKENKDRDNFFRREEGAALIEFVIVLYPFFFLLLGTIQTALLVTASFYTGYANFMALRTASVHYESMENGLISESDFRRKCEEAALSALGPMEPYWWTNEKDSSSKTHALERINFIYKEDDEKLVYENKPAFLNGRLEYGYPLIMPFVNRVFSALSKDMTPEEGDYFSRETMYPYETETPENEFPTFTLRSNNDLSENITTEGPPYFHKILIQRRWLYPPNPVRK